MRQDLVGLSGGKSDFLHTEIHSLSDARTVLSSSHRGFYSWLNECLYLL